MSAPRGRALVMGIGSFGGGVGAARHLVQEGWQVTATDLRDQHALAPALAELRGLPIDFVLGEHRAIDFERAELVLANPAVAMDNPWLQLAREHGARITTEIELFIEGLGARLVLVTGTQGKSSTCHLLETLLRESGRNVYLGGNIGGSLLAKRGAIKPTDFVILELSSYQLEALALSSGSGGRGCAQAVCVTNLRPDHLERHGTFEAYGRAKRHILKMLRADGLALLGPSACLEDWRPEQGHRLRFGSPESDLYIQHNAFMQQALGKLADVAQLRLPGDFQRANALAALGLAAHLGLSAIERQAALPHARGLAHRLERLAAGEGLVVHDNGVSTTPDSTLAALESLPYGQHLLLGGRSKGLPWAELARAIRQRAAHVELFGEARAEIAQALAAQDVSCRQHESLQAAVAGALDTLQGTGHLLFSPACSSFDAFPNFKARALVFQAALAASLSQQKV